MSQPKPTDNRYIYVFTIAMTSIVAVILGLMFFGLRPIHAANEAVFNKRAILASLGTNLPKSVADMSDGEVQDIFNDNMTTYVINNAGDIIEGADIETVDMAKERKKPEDKRQFPLYVFNNGTEDFYILSVRGNGLWDEIWGNVALKSDLSTIAGTSFDHKGETPGLGAEIKDNPKFAAQFKGKKIFDYNGTYTSVIVKKGGIQNPTYEVDSITGATVTAMGVSEMLNRGIRYYLPYFEKIKAENADDSRAVGMLLN